MRFHDLTFSRKPRTQLAIRPLPAGGLEVTTWNMVAEYDRGEYAYDRMTDKLHLVKSNGEPWTIRGPATASS